jgi:hypothetical protein
MAGFTTADHRFARSLKISLGSAPIDEMESDYKLADQLAALHIETDQERVRTCLALECAESYRSRMVLALWGWSLMTVVAFGIVLWRVR